MDKLTSSEIQKVIKALNSYDFIMHQNKAFKKAFDAAKIARRGINDPKVFEESWCIIQAINKVLNEALQSGVE